MSQASGWRKYGWDQQYMCTVRTQGMCCYTGMRAVWSHQCEILVIIPGKEAFIRELDWMDDHLLRPKSAGFISLSETRSRE